MTRRAVSAGPLFESAVTEAGLLQRRLSDIPETASRTLLTAIGDFSSSSTDAFSLGLPPTVGGELIKIGADVGPGRFYSPRHACPPADGAVRAPPLGQPRCRHTLVPGLLSSTDLNL